MDEMNTTETQDTTDAVETELSTEQLAESFEQPEKKSMFNKIFKKSDKQPKPKKEPKVKKNKQNQNMDDDLEVKVVEMHSPIVKTVVTIGDTEISEITTHPTIKQKKQTVFREKKNHAKLHRTLQFVLTLLILGTAIGSMFLPFFRDSFKSFTPWQYMVSRTHAGLLINNLSWVYYMIKYFTMAFSVVIFVCFFVSLFSFFSNKQNYKAVSGRVCITIVCFLVLSSMLSWSSVLFAQSGMTYTFIALIVAVILFIVKFVLNITLDGQSIQNDVVVSNKSLMMSFVVTALTLSTLVTPMYILIGTNNRMLGFEYLTGKPEIEANALTMPVKIFIIVSISVTTVMFITSLIMHKFNRKVFVVFNKFTIAAGLLSLIMYAIFGAFYLIAVIQLGWITRSVGFSTFSFIPLCLFALFWLGYAVSRVVGEQPKVEYKIYAEEAPTTTAIGGGTNGDTEVDILNDELLVTTQSSGEEVAPEDPIPAFSELDNRQREFAEKQKVLQQNIFDGATLPQLVNHIIEYAQFSKDRLSYKQTDIKTFIAGLSASKLAILQGMSGTGKTSLPKIFMEALDGQCKMVAIESSWRDKNELLGYYNQFNKKYTPKMFTQHLYEASLNPDVLYFIVLDEMNLSRIEYYFSDFLSLMEEREENRQIKLFDVQLYPISENRTKYTGLTNGHTINIPNNVWFIGTANRDESTFEISDKVYDRAQTMNFDKRAPKVNISTKTAYPQKYVSNTLMRKLFADASQNEFNAETYPTIIKLEELLRPYNISFGNRVLNQIETFVKTYVACTSYSTDLEYNNTVHEAVDCIIYSKVVRKLEYKQDVDFETLAEELKELNLPKCLEFVQTLANNL